MGVASSCAAAFRGQVHSAIVHDRGIDSRNAAHSHQQLIREVRSKKLSNGVRWLGRGKRRMEERRVGFLERDGRLGDGGEGSGRGWRRGETADESTRAD
jgi:hypothetical protein